MNLYKKCWNSMMKITTEVYLIKVNLLQSMNPATSANYKLIPCKRNSLMIHDVSTNYYYLSHT